METSIPNSLVIETRETSRAKAKSVALGSFCLELAIAKHTFNRKEVLGIYISYVY